MKKKNLIVGLSLLLCTATIATACGTTAGSDNGTSTGDSTGTVVDNYYSIDVSSIRTEMLAGSTVQLLPTFTNLGEPATPNYKVEIKLDNADVTSTVYDATTKVFAPTATGSYAITITVLNDDGTVYETSDGETFTALVTVDVVNQSFAPVNSSGPNVTISNGTITFGEQYSTGSAEKIDSFQYKVTGVTFEGSYSITYNLTNIAHDPSYNDPSLYFGWNKNWPDHNDDCIKIQTNNGRMAAWVWGETGDPADLGINTIQGWNKGAWWNAPGSVSNDSPVSGNHTLTFERYVNPTKKSAVYGILFDGHPYTYLNVGTAYTDLLTNVWVESNNTSGSISVAEFKNIEDTTAPAIVLDYTGDHFVGDAINLKRGATVTDDSTYSSILVPTFKVFNADGDEQSVINGSFTPTVAGTYTVKSNVNDLAMNSATEAVAQIVVTDAPVSDTVIDVSQTTSVAMPDGGVVLYYSATTNGEPTEVTSITVSNGTDDVTSTTIFNYESEDGSKKYKYFKAPAGDYTLTFATADGTTKNKEINVADTNTQNIYGFNYYDVDRLIYKDRIIVGRNTIIYTNMQATDNQSVKLGFGINPTENWTIEYDVTDLSFADQGQFSITKNNTNAEGVAFPDQWDDLAIGGKPNNDLWGYEACVAGEPWITYQWKSTWDGGLIDYLPNPDDPSIGCGRGPEAYSQYGIGTHTYKIVCSTDASGNVTYSYFIDGQPEVVHHTSDAHDNMNAFSFIQFSSRKMNGIVDNVRIY